MPCWYRAQQWGPGHVLGIFEPHALFVKSCRVMCCDAPGRTLLLLQSATCNCESYPDVMCALRTDEASGAAVDASLRSDHGSLDARSRAGELLPGIADAHHHTPPGPFADVGTPLVPKAVCRLPLRPTALQVTDADILIFALNLEYLEGEFYACATTGLGLPDNLRGGGPASIGCEMANLTGSVAVSMTLVILLSLHDD